MKRVNLGPESQPVEKRGKAYHNDDDRLSELPNDVLIVILSSLPLREAARTSLLSSRWANLWRHSSCLNLDATEFLHKQYIDWVNSDRNKYINWVNSLLRLHKAPMLDEFSISFDFDRSSHKAITLWLQFAFARRVKRLELRCLEYKCTYDFPAAFLGRGTRRSPSLQPLLKSLKALCLRRINVTGEDIDFFLLNCPFLEQLIVQASHTISKVEVCGPSLALKHLEIFDSYISQPTIKISAPNLTSLTLEALQGVLLENVPMLVELNLICDYHDLYYCKLVHLQQLEILSTYCSCFLQLSSNVLPQMPKLKKLKVRTSNCEGQIMKLTSFMQASPHLQEFEIEMTGGVLQRQEVGNDFMHFTHQHLKVLKLSGNCGSSSEIEFVRNVLMNCVSLQKIIIDPHFQRLNPYYVLPEVKVMEQTTRRHAKHHLEPLVPKHIKLLIL